MKLMWRPGGPVPHKMDSGSAVAMVHGNKAYFSCAFHIYVYSCTAAENKWTKLQVQPCKYIFFGLAVVKDQLTTIGGYRQFVFYNSLFSLLGNEWEEVLPPMPTSRVLPAVVTTPTHLVVAGGQAKVLFSGLLSTVEVLNTETLQWSTASNLPEAVYINRQLIVCNGYFYISGMHTVFSCSVTDLLKSCNFVDGSKEDSVWTTLAHIPIKLSTLATLRGHVLAIGGKDDDNPTGAIHCYDVATNSWSSIGEMPTPRYHALTAVFPNNELVVVGGLPSEKCCITQIGSNLSS